MTPHILLSLKRCILQIVACFVATYLRCGGIVSDSFTVNVLVRVAVKDC